jgi:hypothetical protein
VLIINNAIFTSLIINLPEKSLDIEIGKGGPPFPALGFCHNANIPAFQPIL